jgi:DNA-binding CsgD family transcriptional regulator
MSAINEAAALTEGLATAYAVVVRCVLAESLVHLGQPDRGVRLLLASGGGHDLPRLAPWRRPRMWELLVTAEHRPGGDRLAADRYTELAAAQVRRLPSALRLGYADRAQARTHDAHGRTDQAVERGEAALAHFDTRGVRIDAGRTLLVIAEACLRRGVRDGVAARVERAAELAAECGSPRLAELANGVRQRLAPADGRVPTGVERLTLREAEVATLVSTGLTNTQVAARMRVSVRTVDSHLWRIYHKLGVPNRAALSSVLAQSRAGRPQAGLLGAREVPPTASAGSAGPA